MTYYWNEQPAMMRPRGIPCGVRGLLIATVAFFLFQIVADGLTGGALTRLFALSWPGLKRLFVWQLVTYLFMHGGVGHLLLNMLSLFFIGPDTERALGTPRFLWLYFLSGIIGGVGWLLMSFTPWAVCVGASGAVFGVLGAFAALFPNRPVTLLVFYVLPVTMKAWILAAVLVGIQLLFLVGSGAGGIAYSAHVAGGIAGYLFTMIVTGRLDVSRFRPKWFARRSSGPAAPDSWREGEVDRILDKISAEGIGSLTAKERAFLEQVSHEQRGKRFG